MKKFIIANGIMLALVNTGLALTPQQFARDFIKNNLELKINENITQSSIHEIESNWGRYTPSLMAKLGWSEDKSDPLMPQLPHHLEQSYGEVGIASQTAYGIGINLSTKQDSSNQTVNTSHLERARSEIAGKISVDLMKNIAGRIDLHQQRNWPKLQEIAKMQQVEKNEILLFQALSLFAQYNYLQEQSSVTKEIEKNALGLVTLASKRNAQGLQNQRDLLIYRSNYTGIQNSLLMIESRIVSIQSQLNSMLTKEINQTDYRCSLESIGTPSSLPESIEETRKKKIAESQSIVAFNEQQIADYQLLPDLKLLASWQGIGNKEDRGESWDDSLSREKERMAIELQFTIPFSFNAEKEKLTAKKIASQKALHELNRLRIEHQQESQELRKNYLLSQRKVEIAKEHRRNENEKYLNELQEFKKGMRNTVDLVQFQNDYLKAKLIEVEVYWDQFTYYNQLLLENNQLINYYTQGTN